MDWWWSNFLIAGIIGLGVASFYFVHPAIAVGLVAAIGYYILLEQSEIKWKQEIK